MNNIIFALSILCLMGACKGKKKESDPDKKIFNTISFLKGQVTDVDTSMYNILKIETVDGRSDTTNIRREEFRKYAKDFLEVPDISSAGMKDDYDVSQQYDTLTKMAYFSYTATEPELEVRREDVVIDPSNEGNSQIRHIYINMVINNDDSTVDKKMFWQINKMFRIVTITQKEKAPESIRILEVIWREHPSAN
jgi:hypothetical protein